MASLIVDPEAMSVILAYSHTFVEFDHEILSTVILPLLLIQEKLCQLQTKCMCTKFLLTPKSSLTRKKCD